MTKCKGYGRVWFISLLLMAVFMAGCGGSSDSGGGGYYGGGGGSTADTTPPTVTFTDPANNGIGVPVNQQIAVTFSKAMNPLTLTTATFTVTGPGGASCRAR